MIYIPKRPWWKFWPVVCWRHLRIVPRDSVCKDCLNYLEPWWWRLLP